MLDALLFFLLPMVVADTARYTTAPQCRCSEIDACTAEIQTKIGTCKVDAHCSQYLASIGDPNKIRACLDVEHEEMQRLEQCVDKKVGPLGCTNSPHPNNLTIPLIPLIEAPPPARMRRTPIAAGTPPTVAGGPPALGHYLICVDQCTISNEHVRRAKRNPVSCAFKLKCALAPPGPDVQSAFAECERELRVSSEQRMHDSCACLRNAGVQMSC